MKVLAVIGSYRKEKTIDTLVSKAVEGARAGNDNITVDMLYLTDKKMEYCKNCMTCRNDDKTKEIADCVISDDLTELLPSIQAADRYIFGNPINCGTVTAVMKTFLERTCWTLGKPGKHPIDGCPEPRTTKGRKAIILLSSGIIPPDFREACDDATSLITSNCEACFGAEVIGSLYAGAVENRGLTTYLDEAFKLGEKLVSK